MSVSIYVVAQKELSDDELYLIKSFNTLADNGLTIPLDLREKMLAIVGEGPGGQTDVDAPDWQWHERYELTSRSVELGIKGEGRVMYEGGKTIKMEDIPPGTKAIRIYAMA